jgi:hypothetical protein
MLVLNTLACKPSFVRRVRSKLVALVKGFVGRLRSIVFVIRSKTVGRALEAPPSREFKLHMLGSNSPFGVHRVKLLWQ